MGAIWAALYVARRVAISDKASLMVIDFVLETALVSGCVVLVGEREEENPRKFNYRYRRLSKEGPRGGRPRAGLVNFAQTRDSRSSQELLFVLNLHPSTIVIVVPADTRSVLGRLQMASEAMRERQSPCGRAGSEASCNFVSRRMRRVPRKAGTPTSACLQLSVALVLFSYYPLLPRARLRPSLALFSFAWVGSAAAAPSPSTSMAKSTSIISTSIAPSVKAPLARCAANPSQLSLRVVPDRINSWQVRVVEHKRSKQLYALKYIDKAKCIKQKAVANIIQERRLLEEVCATPPTNATFLSIILTCFLDRPPFHSQSQIRFPG